MSADPVAAAPSRQSIVDLLTPAWDMLVVRRDPHSRQIGVGQGGKPLIAADTGADFQPCRSGVVLKAGPNARYKPGERVAFGNYAMTVLQVENNPDSGDLIDPIEIGIMASTEVLCTWGVSEDALPVPLALEGARYALAPHGLILVERSKIPNQRGSILLPGSYVSSVRSLEATVIDIHPSIASSIPPSFTPGTIVLLHQSAGRPVPFGLRSERVLHSVQPQQIISTVAIADAPDTIVDGESPLRYRRPPRLNEIEQDVVWDEGDPRAPR